MLFSSVTFLFLFLPIVVLIYYLVPRKWRNVIMLIASLIFYAWGEPIYMILMVLTTCLNYVCGIEVAERLEEPQKAKRSLIFALVCNVGLLVFFKYYGFFIDTINAVFSMEISYRELSLPIGISFYTFQAISYLVDVYRGEVRCQKNLIHFALYISMFPQLIAGPIVRYQDIEMQLRRRQHSMERFGHGAESFLIGLVKKVYFADTLGAVCDVVLAQSIGEFSFLTAWVGTICFALQIYFDFSGYSDMAIGLGRMFGFELRKNFDYPYISQSITEFWRRWHISLSTWFREYVYISLGGNRCTKGRQIFNLLLVWSLTGLWHGAAWNFLVWGLYYALLLILEKFVWGRRVMQMPSKLRHIYTMLLVLIGWVFFFSPTVEYALGYIGVLFGIGASAFLDKQALYYIASNWLVLLLGLICMTPVGNQLRLQVTESFEQESIKKVALAVGYMILFFFAVACIVTESFHPFLYFRF
jgi:alginate O-acetyltransferase complex protein AlgI